jgi:hypothetical protein
MHKILQYYHPTLILISETFSFHGIPNCSAGMHPEFFTGARVKKKGEPESIKLFDFKNYSYVTKTTS